MTNYDYKKLNDAYAMTSRSARDTPDFARYTPSMAGLCEARRAERPEAVVVRFAMDDYLGGFWKASGGRVEFIGVDTPRGQRLLVVLETLGVPLPDRWR
jgi:hypothetical protein